MCTFWEAVNRNIICYFPIQKLEKIFPNNSSEEIEPVITPKWCNAVRKSTVNKSPVKPLDKPSLTAKIAFRVC